MHLTEHPHLVPTDGSFRLADAATTPPQDSGDAETWEKKLKKRCKQLRELQELLYADDRWSLLLVFQALDAAGKDGTIRAVTRGVNPAGVQVYSFKQPSAEELDHDFLWRTSCRLPERGRIGIFNRSYYEELIVVRVHPEYLRGQKLPREVPLEQLWQERYDSIRDQEHHLARNGTLVLKFFLNVSRAEQQRRFVARIDEDAKNWKFSTKDVIESQRYPEYMAAYDAALRETSRPHAPWFCIPADDKAYMRLMVSDVIVKTLKAMPLAYPEPSREEREKMAALRTEIAAELEKG